MINNLHNIDLSAENHLKSVAKYKEFESSIENYISKYKKSGYEIGNFSGQGFSYELRKDLLNSRITEKVSRGWQLTEIDWFAIEDFARAYRCSKTGIASQSLRFYLPKSSYDNATVYIIKKFYSDKYALSGDETQSLYAEKNFHTIQEYNTLYNKTVVSPIERFTEKLYGFSWRFPSIDALAVDNFKKWSGFDYNQIIINAIRAFLKEENYKYAQELIELMKMQDSYREY